MKKLFLIEENGQETELKQVALEEEQSEAIRTVASKVQCKITEEGDILSILEDARGHKVVDYISHYEDDFLGFIYKPEEIYYELDRHGEEYPVVIEEEKHLIGLITLPDARKLIREGYKVLSSPLSSLQKDLEEGHKVVGL